MGTPELVALLGVLLGAFLVHKLTSGRELRSVRRTAATEFHKAFADSLLNLAQTDISTARIVREFDGRHSAAIAAFRPYLPFWKRGRFENAVHRLDQTCEPYRNAGPLTLFSKELGSAASDNRAAIALAIRDLLAFAPLV